MHSVTTPVRVEPRRAPFTLAMPPLATLVTAALFAVVFARR
jgi:hypothetical protein